MNTTEIITDSESIYDGKVITVKKYTVTLPDGKKAFREQVEHRGGACVLAEKDGKILLVSQFRLACGKDILEIPAGKLEIGENPETTALRELEEEGGLKAESMKLISAVAPSPGYTNERIYIYRAEGLRESIKHLDEDEFLNTVWLDKEICFEMIERGEIFDAKTVIALLYLKAQGD